MQIILMARLDKTTIIIKELATTLQIVGHKITCAALVDARDNKDYFLQEDLYKIIIMEICKTFNISKEKLKHSKSHDYRTDAHMVCFYLLKKHVDYTLNDIGARFKKDESVVSKRISAYSKLNDAVPNDRIIKEKCETIEVKILKYLTKRSKYKN